MMMLKFGRIVNLDALEGLTTNKMIGELEQNLQQEVNKYDNAMATVEVSRNKQLNKHTHIYMYTCIGLINTSYMYQINSVLLLHLFIRKGSTVLVKSYCLL